jgi:23S rRNA G2069 N7-methylase RlmK/C1962 C5-methylase RlmI
LKKGGVLVTSINSENYSERNFLKDIEAAAQSTRSELRVLSRIDLPPTFPTGFEPGERYLKGFFLYKV